MEKRIRWYQRFTDASWRVDETYVKVAGEWAYLYRALGGYPFDKPTASD